MSSEIIIRGARPEDYPSFRKMEEEAWKGSGVEIISEEIFLTWLEVFPNGLRLAINNEKVCGHIYAQICNFDAYDENDNRSWHDLTDFGFTKKTHNSNGNCMFVVSVSATKATAGKKLAASFIKQTDFLSKYQYVGICRMPGLSKYAIERGIKDLTKKDVSEYAQRVYATMRKNRKGNDKLFDHTLSTFLRIGNSKVCRVIENFLPDRESHNWACVIIYENNDCL